MNVKSEKIMTIVKEWQDEYNELKTVLYEFGDLSNNSQLVKYNNTCSEAMRLHECINDVVLMIAGYKLK